MKKEKLVAIICFGIAFLVIAALLPLSGADNLYGSVIRIHVLANSDSEKDQQNKLSVRDEILKYARENFDETESPERAEMQLRDNLDEIEKIAQKALEKEGCLDPVSVSLSEEYYPTREYETLSLPAGNYLSLRVQIGKAKGQNWWCVLFPPICLSSAVEAEDALAGAGMEEENIHTVTSGKKEYRYRFKILEIWEETKETIKQLF